MEKLPKYSEPRSLWGAWPPGAPYQGSALNPLETLSGPQTPRRLSSPLTQNPGSAPVHVYEIASVKDYHHVLMISIR